MSIGIFRKRTKKHQQVKLGAKPDYITQDAWDSLQRDFNTKRKLTNRILDEGGDPADYTMRAMLCGDSEPICHNCFRKAGIYKCADCHMEFCGAECMKEASMGRRHTEGICEARAIHANMHRE